MRAGSYRSGPQASGQLQDRALLEALRAAFVLGVERCRVVGKQGGRFAKISLDRALVVRGEGCGKLVKVNEERAQVLQDAMHGRGARGDEHTSSIRGAALSQNMAVTLKTVDHLCR